MRTPSVDAARTPLWRRTALGAAAGALASGLLGGCALDGLGVQVPGEGSAPSASSSAPARSGDSRADERLVARLVGQISPVLDLSMRTTTRHPQLRTPLAAVTSSLRTDLTTLRRADTDSPGASPSAGPSAGSTTTVPTDQAAARRAVVRATTGLRDSLAQASTTALSGRFARLIAAMSAALAQRLQALSPTPLATTVPDLSTSRATSNDDRALQRALAGEHASVWVYSVLAAQTSQSSRPQTYARLLAAYDWHRDCRDRLVDTLRARGSAAAAAAPAYALPNAVSSPAEVTAAALVTEQRLTEVDGRLVQETVGGDRTWAIALLQQSALRQLSFGGRVAQRPGF